MADLQSFNFYTGFQDTNLTKDATFSQGDVYAQALLYEGKSTYTASSDSWSISDTAVADALISVKNNFYVVDDDGLVCAAPITDNDTSSVTVDATTLILESGTTAGAFTDGSEYDIKIYTATTTADAGSGLYGKFMGLLQEVTIGFNTEKAKLTYGVPRTTYLEGYTVYDYTINFSTPQVWNADFWKLIYNAAEFGDQTSSTQVAIGSNPASDIKLMLTIIGKDYEGETKKIEALEGVFMPNGEVGLSTQEAKAIPVMYQGYPNRFYPRGADLMIISELR